MLSGGKAGLVSVDILRKEQEENRRRDRNNQPLEGFLHFSFSSSFIIHVDNRAHRMLHHLYPLIHILSVIIVLGKYKG